jgi:hypothetical protein
MPRSWFAANVAAMASCRGPAAIRAAVPRLSSSPTWLRPAAPDRRLRRPKPALTTVGAYNHTPAGPRRPPKPRGWVTFTRSLPPGSCAIYCAQVIPKVLLKEAPAPSSAAIVGTNLGIGTNVDANISQFLPTAYRLLRYFGRGNRILLKPPDLRSR